MWRGFFLRFRLGEHGALCRDLDQRAQEILLGE